MEEPASIPQPPQRSPLAQWGPVLLILAVVAFYIYGTRKVEEPPGWQHDFAAAFDEAKTSGRKVLLAFHSEGCPPCATMDRTTLRAEIVRDAMAPFIPVRVDAWAEPELARRYGVFATPTYFVVRPDGTPISQAQGFLSDNEFVLFLNQAS